MPIASVFLRHSRCCGKLGGGSACAKVLQENHFKLGVACPCLFYYRKRGIKAIVHAHGFLSGVVRHQLEWMHKIIYEHFETKRTMMGASVDLDRSFVVLNRKVIWHGTGII